MLSNAASRVWANAHHGGDASSLGILLNLASVGLIAAAIIGVFFGTGLW